MYGYSTVIAAACLLICAPMAGAGSTIYVDDSAPTGGDGASWNSAFRHLQDALAAASDGDELRVAQGTYRPDLSDQGNAVAGDVNATFQLLGGMTLRGGFAGFGTTDPDSQDPNAYHTILSADVLGDDGDNFENYSDNIRTIMTATNATPGPVIDGFVFRGGYKVGEEESGIGGGLLADPGEPVIRNCTFTRNWAGYGAGVYVRNGTVHIDQCQFLENRAVNQGAGFRARGCTDVSCINSSFVGNGRNSNGETGGGAAIFGFTRLTLTGCRFEENKAVVGGGCAISEGGEAVVSRCDFNENIGLTASGGLNAQGLVTMSYCTFRSNQSGLLAGGAAVGPGSYIANCLFVNNNSGLAAGGLMASATIVNCVFYQNFASDAAGLYATDTANVVNCTIYQNDGNGLSYDQGSSNVRNCIVWGNTPGQITDDPLLRSFVVNNSDVQGGWSGAGNFDDDPLFVQPGTHNFRLGFGSACLGAGNNTFLPVDLADLDGDGDRSEAVPIDFAGVARIADGTVDVGAFEGAFEVLQQAAMNDDWDPGEWVLLVPSGGDPAIETTLLVRARNMSDIPNATIVVTDLRSDPSNPDTTQPMIRIESNLPAGEVFIRTKIPFNRNELAGADPLSADLTRKNTALGDWVLAPATNLSINYIYNEPIGHRYIVQNGGTAVPSLLLGDYGVYYNTSTTNGYVWANTDQTGEYSMRAGVCPGDGVPYGGNGVLNVADLFGLIAKWGTNDRWFDTNDDGVINSDDLTALFAAWGACN